MIGMGMGLMARQGVAGGAVPEGPATAKVATLAAYAGTDLVFDSGAAFGRAAATLPVAGTTDAADGAAIEARTVYAADGAQHSAWATVGTAGSGAFSGAMTVARPTGARSGAWLRREVRVAGSTAAPARDVGRCGVGHVIGVAGQSEPRRTFLTDSGKVYSPLPAEQVQVVWGFPQRSPGVLAGGGQTIADFSATRHFMDALGDNPASAITHAADIFAKNSGDLAVFIDMTISGTSRTHLSNDGAPFDPTNRRRWEDMLTVLDVAGWADGVRPGLIVDIWTNADGSYAWDFPMLFKPFYTGKNMDGSPYVLGTDMTVKQFGTGTDATHRHDHILFDLTGGGRGLFDETETKVTLVHHRYDPVEANKTNWLYKTANQLDLDLWAQEVLRTVAFPTLLADPDVSRIMVRGTEPLNYENGTDLSGTNWGDIIHPGQGQDGLTLFARHYGHAALHALGLAGTTIPEFDGAAFDPAGGYADFTCSAGPVTTTRRLRGLPQPDPVPGAHWTDVLGFEFNGRPVDRAEIRPDGSVRVFVPPALAPADWSRDRIWFGRGDGTGTLLRAGDPLAGGWLNYPVVEATSLGLAGAYDDRQDSAGGIALRPMPPETVMTPAAYRAAAITLPEGAFFQSDQTIGTITGGVPVTELRIELVGSFNKMLSSGLYLMGAENRAYATMNRNLGFRTGIFGASPVDAGAAGYVTPAVRHRFLLTYDLATKAVQLLVDDNVISSFTSTATVSAINSARRIHLLAFAGLNISSPGFELVSARVWLNDLAGAGTPTKALLASSGAAALNADGWKRGPAI